ncbi:putative HNHc nuclease [Crassaminicella thermophila]|uniref:putative HNHc nuclease n=1 Tax=Crassaminicella thermophila TaxID=2599308 RepID=UPI001E60FEBB|nr:putative HNHc nuclease [Crassaminicella thermophila]
MIIFFSFKLQCYNSEVVHQLYYRIFVFRWNIPLLDHGLNRTDDIGKYLWQCLKIQKCAICGKKEAEIHHWDAIGRGIDRKKYDDSKT